MIAISSYRLQFRSEFGFAHAEQAVPYLNELGISSIYASPVFQAGKGSIHGYDILDHTRLNPELGSRQDFDNLIRRVQARGMSWIQDIVPNHMAYSPENSQLAEVLSCGPHSRYAPFFDIDFEHDNPNLRGRILAPFLGTPSREALERGDIRLAYQADGFCLEYFKRRMPLNPRTHLDLLNTGQQEIGAPEDMAAREFLKFENVLELFRQLGDTTGRESCSTLFFTAKKALWELRETNPPFREWLEQILRSVNQPPPEDPLPSCLSRILAAQFYRLSYFRTAMQEINYRRFFTINDLICMNLDHPESFERVHRLPFELVQSEAVQGLRIDHLDGIADPEEYLLAIRRQVPAAYLLIEKILEADETIPASWPIQGSTGYDFLNVLNGVFVDSWGEELITRIYGRFLGVDDPLPPGRWAEQKRVILEQEMQGDLENLTRLFLSFLAGHRPETDLTQQGLRRALAEVLIRFPVYRSYLSPKNGREQDRKIIREALAEARKYAPEVKWELQVLEELFLDFMDRGNSAERAGMWPAIRRFQQLSGPLMAKGFEDTYLYLNNRLISLNEVGGSPERFGLQLDEYHQRMQQRAVEWPLSLNATATHDTKRGEDVRARVNVLSEIPEEWQSALEQWGQFPDKDLAASEHEPGPTRNDRYLLFQTLLGAFPFDPREYPEFRERIKHYLIKAVREGKVNSQWLQPDEAYEQALMDWIDRLLPEGAHGDFLEAFRPLQSKVAAYGIFNSLSQTLLKLTLPGVPDFYQGTELWDFSLVDPDNRRLVDYAKRKKWLDSIRRQAGENLPELLNELLATRQDGRIKMYLVWKGLQARNRLTRLFASGRYVPLSVQGRHSRHLLAFAREYQGQWVVVLAPRFVTSLMDADQLPCGREIWGDTRVLLPEGAPGGWRECLSERRLQGQGRLVAGEVLERFPAGLLESEGEEG